MKSSKKSQQDVVQESVCSEYERAIIRRSIEMDERGGGACVLSAKVINMGPILISAVSVSLGGLRTTPARSMIIPHPPAAMHSNNPTAPFHG